MTLNVNPILGRHGEKPLIIAGPCSAESEEQVLETAIALAKSGKIDIYRAGIWKPRTRPNSFEGIGKKGLKWLQKVKEETGLRVTTEVANKKHVEEALKHNIDVLWIGARTTVNPFSVQEIADALKGTDIPVLVKNPINPDVQLWIGAIERIAAAGITQIAAIHRGFAYYGNTDYRNIPIWQIPIELKRLYPHLQVLCDNSHICGRRDILETVAQKAFDLNFDGLMTEVHPDPDNAWSDAAQQITPSTYIALLDRLQIRLQDIDDPIYHQKLNHLRGEVDEIDDDLLYLISRRMELAEKMAFYKKENNISILQTKRWTEIIDRAMVKGNKMGLTDEFIYSFLKAIHQESINHQAKIMQGKLEGESSDISL
jgi:chorismate mutase